MLLNRQQKQAIEYLDGPLLVLAGAGSGKTRVITEKIAYLVNKAGYPPQQIAAITFTNKAAKEMQERIAGLLSSQQCKLLNVSTFHSLGMRMLREEANEVGLKKKFSIFDAGDSGKFCMKSLAAVAKMLCFGRSSAFRCGKTPY
jgi:ATP-dependent DNA helicase Rep